MIFLLISTTLKKKSNIKDPPQEGEFLMKDRDNPTENKRKNDVRKAFLRDYSDVEKDVFNRLDRNISNLRTLSYQFTAIIISTISIVGTFLAILIQTSSISSTQITLFIPLKYIILFLFSCALILGFISSFRCLQVMRFKKYKELAVFDDYKKLKNFREKNANEETIYEHFHTYMKESYDYNKKKYEEELKKLENAMVIFFVGFIILLLTMVIVIIINFLR